MRIRLVAPERVVRPPPPVISLPDDMDPDPVCPICQKIILGDLDDINAHIDECVGCESSSGVASVASSTINFLPPVEVLSSAPASSILNIDDDDMNFGKAQYTEADIERINTKSIQNAPSKATQKREAQHARLLQEILASASTGPEMSQLQSLLRSLLEQISSAPKCSVCWETLRQPSVVSVNCWHVCCEECWLRTLGTKRLCPQCSCITNPADLRKIFF